MCQIASLFLLQGLKGSISGDAHATRAVIKFFFVLQGKAQKENSHHSKKKKALEENAPSYASVKNWVTLFKRGEFSTYDAPRPEPTKTVTNPGIIDQIHELILEDRRISFKSIAEQLGISRGRVGSIIHEDLDMRKLSMKWVPKCLNADQNVKGASRLKNFRNFFGRRDPNDFLSGAIGDHALNLVISL